MHPFHSAVLEHFARHYGVSSGEQLRALGLTRHQIELTVERRQIIAIHGGVYRLASTPESFEGRCLAACLADPELAISHQSAGRLSGIRQMRDVRYHVSTSHGRHPVVAGDVRVHHTGVLDPDHVRTRKDGIRLTSPARTMFDLAKVVGPERLESAVEHALRLELTTIPELWEIARRLAVRGRPGSGRFVRLLHARPAWLRPVDSDLELRFERAVMAAGLPQPVRQHPIRLRTGVKIHPDLAWPNLCLAAEVDHVTWHGGIVPIIDDRTRDRQLRLLSWQVERITDREITTNLGGVVRDFVELYHQRSRTITT